ncbi:MAG TPA: hypothetical protein VFG36_01075, partial [Methanoregula sp.]|nr:hypothetical protein [Methanoregula sp.]
IKQMSVMECLYFSIICDEPRRPRRGSPRGGSVSVPIFANTSLPRSASERPEAGDPPEIALFNDFHGSGANSRSYPFLQTLKKINIINNDNLLYCFANFICMAIRIQRVNFFRNLQNWLYLG